MKLYILGACGTFMAGLATIARQLGHEVVGIDQNVYPPMSDFLAQQGIVLLSGYEHYSSLPSPDLVIIGNAMSRGNPAVEHVLTHRQPYISGPQWLYEEVLCHKRVLAISGTHGKTTTSSMLAWILECAGLSPSFLIGGIPKNFNVSARFTESPYFVIEADEYDSAFFDKRSKFLHYRPECLVINNIEFDHADIFSSIDDIKKQFHYLLRTVPSNGQVIFPSKDQRVAETLAMGVWSEKQSIGDAGADWQLLSSLPSGQSFSFAWNKQVFHVDWQLTGQHNVMNALAAIASAHYIGVSVENAVKALADFQHVKRRLERIAVVDTIEIFEDFAHHPTAIQTTLEGVRALKPQGRLVVLLELASNTMRAGIHRATLIPSLALADDVHILQTKPAHDFFMPPDRRNVYYHDTLDDMLTQVCLLSAQNDTIIIMSNRDFGGIYKKLPEVLRYRKNEYHSEK